MYVFHSWLLTLYVSDIYTYTYVCVYTYVHMYIRTCILIYIQYIQYVHKYTHMYICTYIPLPTSKVLGDAFEVRMYVDTHVHTY